MRIEQIAAYGIGALILLTILYLIWPYLVGFLAVVGAFHLYQHWKQSQR